MPQSVLVNHPSGVSAGQGYEQCAALAKSHYENFTVVSRFLPGRLRKHLYAIYAFCRTVDDLGDEHAGDRLSALNLWERDLLRCYEGKPEHPYLTALQQTIKEFDIPRDPFLRLVEANRMDQRTNRYESYEDLDSYCQHSANPVGRLVLYVFGYGDEQRQHYSDATCTALQLTNFWQDVARDYAMNRIYIPLEDMRQFGYSEEELGRGVVNEEFRALMTFLVDRARGLFAEGEKLIDTLDGQFKLDVALFTKGGERMLDLIERRDYDVLSSRPALSRYSKLRLMMGTFLKLKLLRRA